MAEVAEKPAEEVIAAIAEKEVEEEKTAKPAEEENSEKSKESEKQDANDEDDSDEGVSKFDRRIIRQVEYYFGDANLHRDKFLLEQITKGEDGWVPLSVLLTFKRLSELSTDGEVIVNALLKSDEGLVEISEDRLKMRRHPERPIPEHNEERRKEIMSRTAYAKGFPLDTEMSDLIEFFAPYEKVLNINMRKYLDKATKTYKFKGSVFVTFEKKEQTQEFIEKEKVIFQDRELLRKWQENYLDDKKEENKSKSKKSKGKTVPEEKPFALPKGTVLFFEGATESVTREKIREALEKIKGDWEIAFIDYNKGNKDGHIRFQEENVGVKFIEKFSDKKLKLDDDIELTIRLLVDDEEKAYLEKAIEQMKNRRNHHNKHKGGSRKRRGGYENRNDEKKKKATGGDD